MQSAGSKLSSPEDYISESASNKPATGGWKSNLSPADLSNASVVLNKDENVIFTWACSSTKIRGEEWMAIIATGGLYYFITRIYLKRRQIYTLFVTNKRFIFKENLFDRQGCCQTEMRLLEDHFSYPHSQLAFVATEEVGQKSFGIIPPSVVLEMRFLKYPSWDKMSPTVYVSLGHYIALAVQEAFIWAFYVAYGVNLAVPGIKMIHKLIKVANKYDDVVTAMYFGACFVGYMIYLGYRAVFNMISETLKGKLLGPMQVRGEEDHTKFRFHIACSENPNAVENLRKILQLVTDYCLTGSGEDGNSVDAFCEPVVGPIERVPEGAQGKNVNVKKSSGVIESSQRSLRYLEGTNFISHDAYIKLSEDEVYYEATSNNPHWTYSDISQCVTSCGIMYLSDIASRMAHSESYALTNRRIIRHSILISGRVVDHSRVDFWILPRRRDETTMFSVMKFMGEHELIVSTEEFDALTIRVSNTNKLFLCSVAKMLASAVPHKPKLFTQIPGSEIPTYEDLEGAKMSKYFFSSDSSELVENAVGGKLPRSLFEICNCSPYMRNFFTMSSRGIYVEKVGETIMCRSKVLDMVYFLPWSIISGVKWENWDYQLNCTACWCMTISCNCCKFGASSSHVRSHGESEVVTTYAGTKLTVFVNGDGNTPFEIYVPGRYVGVDDNALNAAAKSLNEEPKLVPAEPLNRESTQGVKPQYILSADRGGTRAKM